jgi:uncharacterized protein YccT (UPF0319 family)
MFLQTIQKESQRTAYSSHLKSTQNPPDIESSVIAVRRLSYWFPLDNKIIVPP